MQEHASPASTRSIPKLNCFCFVYPEEALQKARAAEAAVTAGKPLGPLHGVPIAIKDLTPTKGKRTTLGSYSHEHWVPDYDAAIVEKLTAAGAIMVGKTTTPEFAYSSFTESPLWGITRNPWNPERTPGGSSGGSGAAVASGCVPLAEGTDMGGSVRIPAAWCGIVGLKPSLGRIPLDLLPSVFDNISHFGPLARTIDDARLFLNAAQGPDERDIQSIGTPLALDGPQPGSVKGMRFALNIDLGCYVVDPEVEAAVREAARALTAAGRHVEEVALPWTRRIADAWVEVWQVFMAAYFGHVLEQYRDKMDPHVVALIEAGNKMPAAHYKRLEIERTEQWRGFYPILQKYDAFLCPTMRVPAPRVRRARRRLLRDARGRPLLRPRHDRPVQSAGALPGPVGAGGLEQGRPSHRAADRRPPLARRHRADHRQGAGSGAALGRQTTADLKRRIALTG